MATTKKKVRKVKAKVDPRSKFQALRDELGGALVARGREIDGLLMAMLARVHILLLGPPGTAKSMMVRLLSSVVAGSNYYSIMMTRFTLPEHVNGPLDIVALKNSEHKRVTAGYLPEAHFAFLDEVFKANSSILNSLLQLINEREYRQGTQVVKSPIETVVGASNELPESNELDALYDRFLVRFWTKCIADRNEMKEMLLLEQLPLQTQLTLDDIHEAQDAVQAVEMHDDMIELLLDIKDAIEKAGYAASDRRWKSLLSVLKAKAYLEGRDEVEEDDLLVLSDLLWKDPKDRPNLLRVITKAANPALHTAQEILDQAKEKYATIPFTDEVPDHETAGVFENIVNCNTMFTAQVTKLRKLTNGAGNVAVQEIIEEIEEMSTEASRFAARVSGLNL